MFSQKKMLHKMGYRKGDELTMEVKDIIELGKMGYTKEEIEAMKETEKPEVPEDVKTQLDALSAKLDKLEADAQSAAARGTASTTDPGAPAASNVDDILLKMAGVPAEGN